MSSPLRAVVESPDHFSLLQLDACFDIDLALLEKNYIELQNRLHPDRFAGKSGAEKLAAQQQAADVNAAYHTLKDPVKRANYILRQRGGFDLDTERTIHDQDLLMEMLERREALQSIGDETQIAAMEQEAARDVAAATAQLSALMSKQDWAGSQKILLRLQYLRKFENEARQKKLDLLGA